MTAACRIPRLGETSFDEMVLKAPMRTLVHFAARESDCEQCDLASCQPNLQCFCVAADRSPGLASRYAIGEYPTILVFSAGRVVRRLIGQCLPGQVYTILQSEGLLSRKGP
jgi:hypothetical protein